MGSHSLLSFLSATLVLILLLPSFSEATSELEALFRWKQSIGDQSIISSWVNQSETTNSGTPIQCKWRGIQCNGAGSVIGLNLSDSGLQGTLDQLDLSSFPNLLRLDLKLNRLTGTIPVDIGVASKLEYLDLSTNSLNGTIPLSVSNLTKVVEIDFSRNNLTGRLDPGLFPNGSVLARTGLVSLQRLLLEDTFLTGNLPSEIGNLENLTILALDNCRFSGTIPPSLCNLTKLTYLHLNQNQFTGRIPENIGNLVKLTELSLFENQLTGTVPEGVNNLTSLVSLHFLMNNLSGEVPGGVCNSRKLVNISLGFNNFSGPIPSSLRNCTTLYRVRFEDNQLTGELDRVFGTYPKLSFINLSGNLLTGKLSPQWGESRGLTSLNLGGNSIEGEIPNEILQLNRLAVLDLSSNQFSGEIPPTSGFKNLKELDLSDNFLQGQLIPYLPLSLSYFSVSNNKLVGDIPSSICNLSILEILDLSHNNLSGLIPRCISNFSNALLILNMGMNGFTGTIPMKFSKGNHLKFINLNGNHLEGQLPRSLANCRDLEVLDLGSNKINDTFPYWLHSLPELQVLVLRYNKFHGFLRLSGTKMVPPFLKLRILDLSHNEFIGPLPTNYFLSLHAMRSINHTHVATLEYMGWDIKHETETVVITLKGVVVEFQRILKNFATVDFSCNKFVGHIPNAIGSLHAIRSLNLSSNALTGQIPLSLANLTVLESLDLSSNQLSGVIPQEIARVTTLAVLNLSSNRLSGPIPRGFQFDTFENNSYDGNLGLCGLPLTKKCSDNGVTSNHQPPASVSSKDDEEGLFDGFTWKSVLLGYGCGTVFGLGIGLLIFVTGKPKLLVTIVEEELLKLTKQTGKRRAPGNRNGQRRR